MNQYTAGEQSDILKRIAELEEQDRQYSLSQTSLQQNLATDLYTLLKQKEDAAAAAKKSFGGGYTPKPVDNSGDDAKSTNLGWANFFAWLNGEINRVNVNGLFAGGGGNTRRPSNKNVLMTR